MSSIFNFSYKKVGGLHFIRLGRLGFSFFVSRSVPRTFLWEPERKLDWRNASDVQLACRRPAQGKYVWRDLPTMVADRER